jgi:hypothetical protein
MTTITDTPSKAQMHRVEAEAHRMDAKRTRSAQAQLQKRATKPGGRAKRKLSFHDAAVQVLQHSDGPMKSSEIMQAVLDRKLADSKGKTPAATMSTILLRGERRKVFVKSAPGTYDLRELNPRGAKKRPS